MHLVRAARLGRHRLAHPTAAASRSGSMARHFRNAPRLGITNLCFKSRWGKACWHCAVPATEAAVVRSCHDTRYPAALPRRAPLPPFCSSPAASGPCFHWMAAAARPGWAPLLRLSREWSFCWLTPGRKWPACLTGCNRKWSWHGSSGTHKNHCNDACCVPLCLHHPACKLPPIPSKTFPQ